MSHERLFRPSSIPKHLGGVTAELLAGLHGAAWAWGALHGASGRVYLWVGEPREVRIVVHDDPENPNFGILATRTDPTREQYRCVNLASGATVRVDSALLAPDLFMVLHAVNARAVVAGLFDPRSNTRGVGDRARQITVLSAGAMFEEHQSRYVPQGPDVAECLRAQFREPDQVRVIEGPFGVSILCHARDARRLRVQYAMADIVFREQGIGSFGHLRALPKDRVALLRRVIRHRIASVI